MANVVVSLKEQTATDPRLFVTDQRHRERERERERDAVQNVNIKYRVALRLCMSQVSALGVVTASRD
jgi:hypothetical protein